MSTAIDSADEQKAKINYCDPSDLLIEVIRLHEEVGDLKYVVNSQTAQIVQFATQIRWMGGKPQWIGNHDTTNGSCEVLKTNATSENEFAASGSETKNAPTRCEIETRMNGLNVNRGNLVID